MFWLYGPLIIVLNNRDYNIDQNNRDYDFCHNRAALAGCEGSRVILPALLLTLDKYSSWRVGRVVPTIRSAVRTTLRSLLRSDLVAELNQTVIDVQRTDSMMAE